MDEYLNSLLFAPAFSSDHAMSSYYVILTLYLYGILLSIQIAVVNITCFSSCSVIIVTFPFPFASL